MCGVCELIKLEIMELWRVDSILQLLLVYIFRLSNIHEWDLHEWDIHEWDFLIDLLAPIFPILLNQNLSGYALTGE